MEMAAIETPHELFVHKLGAALRMEHTILEILENLQQKASDSRLERQLEHHRMDTQRQIENLDRAFEALGRASESQPCPVIEGLERNTEQMVDQVDDDLVDLVILDGLIETEHYEIGVYEGLIITAETSGEEDLVPLFQENLEEEQQTLVEAVKAAEQLSYQLSKQAL
jgi:ferritin-like metal-binding protein YciE